MNKSYGVCRMHEDPYQFLCEKHYKQFQYMSHDQDLKGKDRLLCEICFQDKNGLKKVYNLKEIMNIVQEIKNNVFQQQMESIIKNKNAINDLISNINEIQTKFITSVQGLIDQLKNFDYDLNMNLESLSEYNFLNALDEIDFEKCQQLKTVKIEDIIQQKKQQYENKIAKYIYDIKELQKRNYELKNLEQLFQLNEQNVTQIPKLEIKINQQYSPEVIFKGENSEIIESYIPQIQCHTQRKIFAKKIQTVNQRDKCSAISFNKNDSVLATACNNNILLWKFQDGQIGDHFETLSEHTSEIQTIIFSTQKNWLFSAGKDHSIVLWKPRRLLFFISYSQRQQYQKAHEDQILQLLLNQEENQLISCSSDQKISIWQVNYKNNSIDYEYSLEYHKCPVMSISLNVSNNLMASSGMDKQIVLWSLNQQKQWKFKQIINKSVNDIGYRISFISDDTVVWQQMRSGITHIFKQQDEEFKECQQLKLQLNYNKENDGDISFQSIFSLQKQLLIQKFKNRIYFLIINNNNQLTLQQEQIELEKDEIYGNLSNDGKYFTIWNDEKLQVFEIHDKRF